MSATESRPAAIAAASWLLVVGGVLLVLAGLMTATVSFTTLRNAQPPEVSDQSVHDVLLLNRGVGILFGFAGLALIWFASRTRSRDPRFRRAAMTLGLTIVVLVAVASVYGGHILALLGLLPIVTGTLLLSRPSVVEWYANG